MPIKILDIDTSEKIAAGEVVERPFCAVKELVENSIDAGATRINIEIKDKGVELIKITDNGSGMSKEDLNLCILRHATSKIKNIDDLEKINTMGFRGEALAAISRVSKIQISSKQALNEQGYKLISEGGSEPKILPVGMNDGTQIIIQDLFYNTPARKKFLKSKQSEYSAIISNIENTALAYPKISFKLTIDGRERLNLHQVNSKIDRINDVFGMELTKNLLPLNFDNGSLKLTGFISSPEFIEKKRNKHFLFVNKRVVISKVAIAATNDAYKEYIVKGRYPVVFLFLELDGKFFDVNVHPRKIDIKFVNERAIFTMIREATSLTLRNIRHPEREALSRSKGSVLSFSAQRAGNPEKSGSPNQRFEDDKKTHHFSKSYKKDFFNNLKTIYDTNDKSKAPKKMVLKENSTNLDYVAAINKEFTKNTKSFDLKKKEKLIPLRHKVRHPEDLRSADSEGSKKEENNV